MNTQPVAIAAVVQIVVTLAVTAGLKRFPGLDLTPEQIGAIIVVLNGLAMAAVHRLVTPVADPKLNDGTPLVPAPGGPEL